jgi:hypothetical protein
LNNPANIYLYGYMYVQINKNLTMDNIHSK